VKENSQSYPFPILANRKWWFLLSLLMVTLSIGKMVYNKATTGYALSYGVDFTGGSSYLYEFDQLPGKSSSAVTAAVRDVLEQQQVQRPAIQVFMNNQQVGVRTQTGADADAAGVSSAHRAASEESQRILSGLNAKFGGNVRLVANELVGPIIGRELRSKGIWAVLLGSIMMMLYIWWRYNIGTVAHGWLFGLCAVIAMLHDVQIIIGAYAWTGTEVNSSFVAAVLTIIGYSVNDTVVIFDRLRENLRGLDPAQRRNVNAVEGSIEFSLWQTMARSIITGFSAVMVLIFLLLIGPASLKGFAFALLIGIVAGAYSSVFTASPLLVAMNRWMTLRHAEASRPGTEGRPAPRPVAATAPKPTAPPRPAAPSAPAAPGGPSTSDEPHAAGKSPGKGTKRSGKGKRRY
jgi:preprotein translocase subunit SecF